MSKFRFGSSAVAMSEAMSTAKYGPLDRLIHWIRNNNIKNGITLINLFGTTFFFVSKFITFVLVLTLRLLGERDLVTRSSAGR